MGIHNYYKMATDVCANFQSLAFAIKISIRNRLKERVKRKGNNPKILISIKEKYGKSKEMRYINGNAIIPIGYVEHQSPLHKKKVVNKYTEKGRREIHKMLEKVDINIVHILIRNLINNETIEYNDNRISLYIAQNGKCAILQKQFLIERIHCHHKKPRKLGGDDQYFNLVLLDIDMHKLVHSNDKAVINKLINQYNLDKKQLLKLNKLRKEVELPEIDETKINLETENFTINQINYY